MTLWRKHHPAPTDDARDTGSDAPPRGVMCATRRFLRERSGVGAIEFALVAPVLMLLYIGSAEISVALSIDKKVARAASTVADLVTQQDTVDNQFLASMVDVSNAVMSPYNESPVKLTITEIHVDNGGAGHVTWSWDQDGNHPYDADSSVDVPADLAVANTDLLRAQMSFDHSLFLPGAERMNISTLTMSKTYYLRPRGGQSIEYCPSGCSSS